MYHSLAEEEVAGPSIIANDTSSNAAQVRRLLSTQKGPCCAHDISSLALLFNSLSRSEALPYALECQKLGSWDERRFWWIWYVCMTTSPRTWQQMSTWKENSRSCISTDINISTRLRLCVVPWSSRSNSYFVLSGRLDGGEDAHFITVWRRIVKCLKIAQC